VTRKTTILAAVLAILAVGCADSLLGAKIAINAGRAGLSVANIGISVAEDGYKKNCAVPICKKEDPSMGAAYQVCMKKDHSIDEGWKTCYAKFKGFKEKWPQIEKTAVASFNAADAAIKAAEQKKAGLPIDVMPIIKTAACVVAESLEFLPEKYKKQIAILLAMMKTFGCTPPPGT
jgi:hypothetical protein